MAREIIFRGKTPEGEWVYGDLVQGRAKQKGMAWIWAETQNTPFNTFEYHVIPETVGQYTGLTDKNGTKIFEGDVLRVNYSDFVGNCAEWKVFLTDMTDFPMMERINTANEIEVIGNIHEQGVQ